MNLDSVLTDLPFAEACERNKKPILEALLQVLPSRGHVLEIGSGTGQHVVYFAPRFRNLTWQPTERRENLEGLNSRIRLEGGPTILPAIELEAFGAWPDRQFAAAYSSNTAHIMSWEAVCAMFAGLGARLAPNGIFCLYGPFNVDGRYTADSNEQFDLQLKARDQAMGLRDVRALEVLAGRHHMTLVDSRRLPANNQLLVFSSDPRG
jgi:cyclopropane fatty-acyl-phospholipid synthase-like methyltransferase